MSGRLLLICIDTNDKYIMYQMYNDDELNILYDEFTKQCNKSFDLLMLTLSFIYGEQIVKSLINNK